VGHLLATQDERISTNFWGLANALGGAGVQLFGNTRTILDKVEAGELDLGINVLGSYVLAHQRPGGKLAIVMPDDYQLFLPRTALILRKAPHARLAGTFVDWLLSPSGQQVMAQQVRLGSIPGLEGTDGGEPAPSAIAPFSTGVVQPIALSPTLLVGLDQQRNSRFLENWLRLVTDTPPHAGATTGR
jgi:two-component system sensor histidine kinase TctE